MKVWQGIVIFVSGAAAGAVGSLFYLRSEFEQKVEEEIAAREREKAEASNKENEKQRILDTARIDSKVSKEISERERYSTDSVTSMIREPRTGPSRGLKTQKSGLRNVIFSVDESGEVEVDDSPSEGAIDIPYGITSEDFLATRQEYDKTTLTFYMNDQVLANEEGDIVEDPRYLIGEREDWMKEVGRSEDKVAYIRNEKVGTDYEIICEYKSYTDDWST